MRERCVSHVCEDIILLDGGLLKLDRLDLTAVVAAARNLVYCCSLTQGFLQM